MPEESELSERETEILRLVATGASNKEIAQRLVISPNTVKVHLRNIFAKIGVVSRTEAALYAIQHNLVEGPAVAGAESQEELTPNAPPLEEPLAAAPAPPARRVSLRLLAFAGLVMILALTGLWAGRPRTSLATPTPPLPEVQKTAEAQRWQKHAALPDELTAGAGAVYDNSLYWIGGQTDNRASDAVLHYLPDADRWERCAAKPTAVYRVQAALLGEKIYVPGGRLADGRPTGRLEIYDPRQNRWTQGAQLPMPLSDYALAAFEGRLYLFGGWDGAHVRAGVWQYDPAADRWQALGDIPAARSLVGAAALQGKIFLVGGWDGQQALSDVLAYLPARDRPGESPWEAHPPLPQRRAAPGVAALADALYVMGGENSEPLAPLQYNPAQRRWLSLSPPSGPSNGPLVLLPLATRLHLLGPQQQHQSYQALYTLLVPVIP